MAQRTHDRVAAGGLSDGSPSPWSAGVATLKTQQTLSELLNFCLCLLQSRPFLCKSSYARIAGSADQYYYQQFSHLSFRSNLSSLTIPFAVSIFIGWLLRQNWRFDGRFAFLFLLRRIHQLAARIDETRGNEDNQVAFDVLIDIRAERRRRAECRRLIGVRSSVFCTSSRINPPSTTVWPSQTLTLVVTCAC